MTLFRNLVFGPVFAFSKIKFETRSLDQQTYFYNNVQLTAFPLQWIGRDNLNDCDRTLKALSSDWQQ